MSQNPHAEAGTSPPSEAQWLKSNGFHPIPLDPKSKHTKAKGWNTPAKIAVNADYEKLFPREGNLGVLTGDTYSNGLRDIDLDCPEAVRCAAKLLPASSMVWGKNGEARHYAYRCVGLASEKFHDPDGAMLVEIRGDKLQTMVPPSVHPDGGTIQWVKREYPEQIEPEVLHTAVKRLAAAALIARCFPGVGSRHAFTLAMAGYLSAHLEQDVCVSVLGAAMRAAGCGTLGNKWKAIKDTYARLDKDQQATGLPTAISLAPRLEAALPRLKEWLDIRSIVPTVGAPAKQAAPTTMSKARLVLIEAKDVKMERIEWLWQERIALGMLHMLIGDMDMGKGLTIAGLVSLLTTGRPFPDEPENTRHEPRHVLMLCAEDSITIIVKARLKAAGANMDNVTFIDCIEENEQKRSVDLTCDMPLIEETIRAKRTALVVLDPLNAYIGTTDSYTDPVVRQALDPLVRTAGATRVAVLALMHLSKNTDRAAVYRSLGSVAFQAIVRASYSLSRDPDDAPGSPRRLFLQVKKNISAPSPGLVLTIEGTMVDAEDGKLPISTARVVWTKENTTMTADEALGVRKKKSDSKIVQTIEWLEARLAKGPAKQIDLEIEVLRDVGASPTTLRRAKDIMHGVEAKKLGLDGGWEWRLEPGYVSVKERTQPTTETAPPTDGKEGEL